MFLFSLFDNHLDPHKYLNSTFFFLIQFLLSPPKFFPDTCFFLFLHQKFNFFRFFAWAEWSRVLGASDAVVSLLKDLGLNPYLGQVFYVKWIYFVEAIWSLHLYIAVRLCKQCCVSWALQRVTRNHNTRPMTMARTNRTKTPKKRKNNWSVWNKKIFISMQGVLTLIAIMRMLYESHANKKYLEKKPTRNLFLYFKMGVVELRDQILKPSLAQKPKE